MKKDVSHSVQQSVAVSTLYQEVLKARESLDSMVVPSDKIDALHGALDKALRIIENVALFSAAIDANLSAVLRKVDVLAEDPAIGEKLKKELIDLMLLRTQVIEGYFSDEVQFCQNFERMVRDDLLSKAGVDPNDKKKSLAFLNKLGKAILPPGSKAN
jgi:hypothetical protein